MKQREPSGRQNPAVGETPRPGGGRPRPRTGPHPTAALRPLDQGLPASPVPSRLLPVGAQGLLLAPPTRAHVGQLLRSRELPTASRTTERDAAPPPRSGCCVL